MRLIGASSTASPVWKKAHSRARRRGPFRFGTSRPGRELRDFASCLFVCDTDVIGALQVEPELRARAEPMPETKSGVAGDATASMDDLRHAIGRNVDLPRKFRRRDA